MLHSRLNFIFFNQLLHKHLQSYRNTSKKEKVMLIGVIGKPSSGKSTLLNAFCMTDVKMGAYPFTTIKANRGVAYVTAECPCSTLNESCSPKTGKCENGNRYIPVELLDVPGLVPGASEGKGMGNQFLDELRQADILIHVLDVSGTTDEEGNEVPFYEPINDIKWLNGELSAWIGNILFKGWDRIGKKLEADRTKLVEVLNEKLSGLGSTQVKIKRALMQLGLLDVNPREWSNDEKNQLTDVLRDNLFPTIIAANKIDKTGATEHLNKIIEEYPDLKIIKISGLAELTLRKLDEKKIIKYTPGSNEFEVIDHESKQVSVASAIKEKLLDVHGSTGVKQLLVTTIYDFLELYAIYPVEDTTHMTDKDGRVLPDVFLVAKGTTAKQFAGKIHSDLADRFIHAILANKNNKRISANHELEHLDVIKIVSAVK